MKRFNCFFALVCLLLMFSCQKPEGTLPGSWMNAGGNGPVRCSITANMDYAVYEVNVNLGSASLDQLQLNKLELRYFLKGQDQQQSLTILTDTILRSNYQKKDTIWGLIPNSDYQYSMFIADFFNEKTTDTLPFRTLPVDVPVVTLDTAMENCNSIGELQSQRNPSSRSFGPTKMFRMSTSPMWRLPNNIG